MFTESWSLKQVLVVRVFLSKFPEALSLPAFRSL